MYCFFQEVYSMAPTEKADHSGLRDLSNDSGDISQYYDEWAEGYDETLAQWGYEAPERAAARLRAELEPDAVILDAGCGTGLTGKALADAGFTIIDGMDVSQRSLDVAANRDVYRSLEHVDMQKLPLPVKDNSYDGLFCVGVLTYLPDSEGTLREFCRIVNPDGAMVLTHRTDIFDERDFASVLKGLENEGALKDVRISEPSAYLPGNEEFGDEIKVRYITCRAV
jgi:predicted TPR repeat methyltransferase